MLTCDPLCDFVGGGHGNSSLNGENLFTKPRLTVRMHHRLASESISTASHWSIACPALLARQFQETRSGLLLRWKHLALLAAAATDPTTATDNSCPAILGWPDRQGVIARHVLARVDGLAMELKPIVKHPPKDRRSAGRRPTRVLNRYGTTDPSS